MGARALCDGIIGGLVEGIATTDDVVEDSGAGCVGSIDIVIHCWRSIVSAAIVGASISGITSKAICWKWRNHTCSQSNSNEQLYWHKEWQESIQVAVTAEY